MKCSSCGYEKEPACDTRRAVLCYDKDGNPSTWANYHHSNACPNKLRALGLRTEQGAAIDQSHPVPRQYANAVLDTPPWASRDNDGLVAAYVKVRRLRDLYLSKSEKQMLGVILFGPKGTGKTHLAAGLANELRAKGKRAMFLSETDLLNRMKESFDHRGQDAENVLTDAVEAGFLIIDDAGKSSQTPWSREILFHLFDQRYQQRRPSIITTNLQPEELAGNDQWGAIISRLTERRSSLVIGMAGKNLRLERAA